MAEFDFQQASIDEIIDAFVADGSVVLRRFADRSSLLTLKTLFAALYHQIDFYHIYPVNFRDRGLKDFHEYLFAAKHYQLLARLFGEFPYSVYHGTSSRRVDTARDGEGQWMPPVQAHLDSCIMSHAFTINFWVPFQPCGIDASSLGLVNSNFADILKFAGYDGNPPCAGGHNEWNFGNFHPIMRDLSFSNPAAVAYFFSVFRDRIATPAYDLGDAVMMCNWTLHFTHATPEMTVTKRENVELRFITQASLQQILDQHAVAMSKKSEKGKRKGENQRAQNNAVDRSPNAKEYPALSNEDSYHILPIP